MIKLPWSIAWSYVNLAATDRDFDVTILVDSDEEDESDDRNIAHFYRKLFLFLSKYI